MISPQYLTRRKNGVYYVQVPVPLRLRPAVGQRLLERSLRTRDEAAAHKLKHAVIAEFQGQIATAERLPPPPSGSAALVSLARDVEAGKVSSEGFDASADIYLSSHPVDEDGDPILPPADLSNVRRAYTIANGSSALLLENLVDDWLVLLRSRNIKAQTVKERRSHLRRLIDFVGADALPSALTDECAIRFVEQILNPAGLVLERKRFILATCSNFCLWLKIKRLIKTNPFADLGMLVHAEPREIRKPTTWSPNQLEMLLRALPANDPMWPIVALAAYTGARPQELCNVRLVDVTATTLTIPKSKTDAGQRTIPIPEVLLPLVQALEASSDDGYLISGLTPDGADKNRYKLVGKRLGTVMDRVWPVDKPTFYQLRHTATTLMSEAGNHLWVVRMVIGQKGQSVLEVHYLAKDNLELMQKALSAVTFGAHVDDYVRATGAKVSISRITSTRRRREG